VALVAVYLFAIVAVGYWAWPKLRVSDRSDMLFLLVRIAAVLALGLLLIVAIILDGRYCVYKHGAGYCRAHPGYASVILLVAEPLVLIGGAFIALRQWARRVADRVARGQQ
jgi:hypothetical protein